MLKSDRFTLLIGTRPQKDSNAYSFSNIYALDGSVPQPLYETLEQNVLKRNEDLPQRAEELIRKTIAMSLKGTGEAIVYLTDLAYSSDITISRSNPFIFDKIKGIDINSEEVISQKSYKQILAEHHLKSVYAVEGMQIMIHGERDAIRFEYDPSVKELEDLNENVPSSLTFLDSLYDFLNIVKTGVFR